MPTSVDDTKQFPKVPDRVTLPPARPERSGQCTGVLILFHSDGCILVFHGGFNLQSPQN